MKAGRNLMVTLTSMVSLSRLSKRHVSTLDGLVELVCQCEKKLLMLTSCEEECYRIVMMNEKSFLKTCSLVFGDQESVPQFSQLFQILKGSSRSRIAGSSFPTLWRKLS